MAVGMQPDVIFFLTDARNAGRQDLGCPFGCRQAHRRRQSTRRSVADSVTLTPIDVPPSAGGQAYRVCGLVRETKAAS